MIVCINTVAQQPLQKMIIISIAVISIQSSFYIPFFVPLSAPIVIIKQPTYYSTTDKG